MACNSGTCQSGCYRDSSNEAEEHPPVKIANEAPNDVANGRKSTEQLSIAVCVKCKVNKTIASAASAEGGGDFSGGDSGRFCADCFRSNLYGKFRYSVTSNAMISPSDNVLVAFSGGTCSRVALQFTHEMQSKAQKNYDASPDRALPVFGVGVAFIDEKAISAVSSDDLDRAIEKLKLILSDLAPPVKQFHVVPTEAIYSLKAGDAKDRLNELINAVSDVTGKEDLVEHLRMLSLQKIALEHGYTKVLLGTCTSRIACRVLEATVKGRGYSLAADIQYVDARWKIPVVLPLRDCLIHELNTLCSLDSLMTVEVFNGTHAGINGLVSSFVKLLQEENPSRESTIMRTAGKLTPFHFNRMSEDNNYNDQVASQRRQKKYNLKTNDALPPESFCRICSSPLKISTVGTSISVDNAKTSLNAIGAACCASCQFQVLPEDPSSLEHFISLLPPSMVSQAEDGDHLSQRQLREQIEDCLLSDTED
ncbi:PREDICTED: cytoplasmic tRNA 2-thiolation protein 2-like [Nicotiana attenuata]|uniref:Cytoplasmic tRNA 2-thiolation protein 2 n=1 Tax=Nicotiana attenuata TaxID=49451 RepID=A0A1J6IIV4_NICAT|nr:PREDICTED: cytoplasmic tRNA 2-thiolation protein 2-like [Nicotiana attenuata]OIS97662.1 cytoplasmic trna 2-thiolation protein 2 [Nicotiana attenuata]